MILRNLGLFFCGLILMSSSCEKKIEPPGCTNCPNEDDTISGTYAPTPYTLEAPAYLGQAIVPADNPMTAEGIELGRRLFYDPILSVDSTLSCASCHKAANAFSDNSAKSRGVQGAIGLRNAMPLVNLAFNPNGFFWDGRRASLEEQALDPVEDHLEMRDTWENVEKKLRRHADYPVRFRQAFGIEQKKEINRLLVVKAIAQFERTLISANSTFDQVFLRAERFPTDAEQRGKMLFFFEPSDNFNDHPGCSHCHSGQHLTDFSFRNNGLDAVDDLANFLDLGRGGVNGNLFDNGKFRVPSLRNVALTAPYMHDGRFQTLEEVLDHYAAGGHNVLNEDANIRPFPLTEQQKKDLVTFLKVFTDTSFIQNPAFQNPFK